MKKILPLSLNFVHPQAHSPWSTYQLTQAKCFFSFFFYKPWKRSLYVMHFYFCAVTTHREVGMKTHLYARFSLDTGLKSNYMGFDKPFFVPYKNPNLLTGVFTWCVSNDMAKSFCSGLTSTIREVVVPEESCPSSRFHPQVPSATCLLSVCQINSILDQCLGHTKL